MRIEVGQYIKVPKAVCETEFIRITGVNSCKGVHSPWDFIGVPWDPSSRCDAGERLQFTYEELEEWLSI